MVAMIAGFSSCRDEPPGPSDEWVRYQESLAEIDDLAIVPPVHAQLDWGDLNVVFDPYVRGSLHANVFTTKDGFVYTENWFWIGEPLAPEAAFGFRYQCSDCALEDPETQLHAEWATDPLYRMDITYHDGLPPGTITNLLVLQNGEIDRHTFVVQDGGETAGYLLREVHHPVGQYFFVDHWTFLANYDPPKADEPEVLVLPNPVQYATTAQFFQALKNQGVTQYAKVTYDEQVGADYE